MCSEGLQTRHVHLRRRDAESAIICRTVSHQNVELVAKLYPPGGIDWVEVFRTRSSEEAALASVRELLHPDYDMAWTDPDGGDRRRVGLDAMVTGLRDLATAFESFRIAPEAFVDCGERVLVLLRREGRTKAGADFSAEGSAVFTILHGLIRRLELFERREDGLAAAGVDAAEAERRTIQPGVAVESAGG